MRSLSLIRTEDTAGLRLFSLNVLKNQKGTAMEYRRFDRDYYIRLDKGDEVIASLIALCEREGIRCGSVSGIGGCGYAAVGVFDLAAKEYVRREEHTLLELVSLNGNITVYEEKPYVHAHALFAYQREGEIGTLTGHLLEAVIELTGELVLTPAEGRITRRYDEALGIRTWDFGA